MVKSWNLDALSVDAPSPSPAPDASLVASSLGTSPAFLSTPVSTATGSTGGCRPRVLLMSTYFGTVMVNCIAKESLDLLRRKGFLLQAG